MNQKTSGCRQVLPAIIVLVAFIIMVFSCGCTQQAAPPAGQPTAQPTTQETFKQVTASQPDNSHIMITYQGGSNMERVVELEITITDSKGKSQTKSAGSRLATTPIPIKGTYTITGDFAGQEKVVVIAHMIDGSRATVLEETI